MALVTCPDCGKQFSDLAAACPNCGRPSTARSADRVHGKNEGCFLRTMNVGCMIVLGIVTLVFVLILIGVAVSEEQAREAERETPTAPRATPP